MASDSIRAMIAAAINSRAVAPRRRALQLGADVVDRSERHGDELGRPDLDEPLDHPDERTGIGRDDLGRLDVGVARATKAITWSSMGALA